MPRLLDWLIDHYFVVFGTIGILMLLAMAACTPQQQQQASGYQQQIAFACGVAMGLAPVAGPYAPWIIGGCATEEAIAKLALDPNSLVWVQGLVAKVREGR